MLFSNLTDVTCKLTFIACFPLLKRLIYTSKFFCFLISIRCAILLPSRYLFLLYSLILGFLVLLIKSLCQY